MMRGLFLAQSVQLDHIARKMPSCAKKLSSIKRFRRFLDNPLVRVRAWFDPFACWTLLSAAAGGVVHLIIDSTKIAFGFRLVMVSVAYRRSLPIAWMWAVGTHDQLRSNGAAQPCQAITSLGCGHILSRR
ncbi:MAG: hypothetical protein H0X30_03665 [Anaerolineae bacterium]|nr:hypothetical protein [Anaerolineae bacterium]